MPNNKQLFDEFFADSGGKWWCRLWNGLGVRRTCLLRTFQRHGSGTVKYLVGVTNLARVSGCCLT